MSHWWGNHTKHCGARVAAGSRALPSSSTDQIRQMELTKRTVESDPGIRSPTSVPAHILNYAQKLRHASHSYGWLWSKSTYIFLLNSGTHDWSLSIGAPQNSGTLVLNASGLRASSETINLVSPNK